MSAGATTSSILSGFRAARVTSISYGAMPGRSNALLESPRDYPCPECGDAVTIGQVQALRQEGFATLQYANEPGFISHVREGLAHQIVSQLLEDGYIKFRRGPDDDRVMCFQMVATVGVVHPSKLDILEQRIAERQDVVAREVADEASHQIDNWGSHYGRADILKRDARQMVKDALQIVMKRRQT